MCLRHSLKLGVTIFLFCLISPIHLLSQTELASLAGTVCDSQGASVPGAQVQATRLETGVATTSVTNEVGFYVFAGLQPGRYRIVVTKPGFKGDVAEGLLLAVQDRREENFSLTVGSVSETVNVEASAGMINTQDASVSTVVDRQFADNLPLNGRSFQTLIDLTPGVVVTSSNGTDTGQFSVNGQRAASNYWMVDGVSANVGSSAYLGGNQPSVRSGQRAFLAEQTVWSRLMLYRSFAFRPPLSRRSSAARPAARFPLSRDRVLTNFTARLSTTCGTMFWTPTTGSTASTF